MSAPFRTGPFPRVVISIAALLLVAAAAWRAGAVALPALPAAPPTAVAVLDFERVRVGLQEAKDRGAALTERHEAYQTELDTLLERRKLTKQDLDLLPKESPEWVRKAAEVIEVSALAKAKAETLQDIVYLEQGDLLREVYLKILDTTRRVAEREGYDLVMPDDRAGEVERGSIQNVNATINQRQVLFASARVDITGLVVDQMNAEYNAPKAPGAPAK